MIKVVAMSGSLREHLLNNGPAARGTRPGAEGGNSTNELTRVLPADFLAHMRAWVKAIKTMNTDEQDDVVYGPSGDSVSRQRDVRDRSVNTGYTRLTTHAEKGAREGCGYWEAIPEVG